LLVRALRQLQGEDRVDEPLLRPVVKISHHAAPLLVLRGNDPRS
jgi:hypothetical protein